MQEEESEEYAGPYHINGVDVDFPYHPYPAQLALMGKIIKTLSKTDIPEDKKTNSDVHHALLESPTGSGKSLSLLCASLGWLKQHKALKIQQWREQHEKVLELIKEQENDNGKRRRDEDSETVEDDESSPKRLKTEPVTLPMLPISISSWALLEEPKQKPVTQNQKKEIKRIFSMLDRGFTDRAAMAIAASHDIPKIYYGTRTHSQIKQVVRELGKTKYRPQICILASRDHYCIHEVVQRKPNKKEECDKLTEAGKCRYDKGTDVLASNSSIKPGGHHEIYDLEDLVALGKRLDGCPYFASREIFKTAEIVLCPYNYLIDPLVRRAMNIDLTNQVVIIDEAHNIEDICRDAASVKIILEDVYDCVTELEKLSELNLRRDLHTPLGELLRNVAKWISSQDHLLTELEYETKHRVHTGKDAILQMLRAFGMSHEKRSETEPSQYETVRDKCIQAISYANNPRNKKRDPEILSGRTQVLLEGLFLITDLMYMQNAKFMTDYRVVILKKPKRITKGWRNAHQKTETSLDFWCMNPAVAFDELKRKTRSVLLTSGTLSPMDSLGSELDTVFHTVYEAPHVIDVKRQVWAGTVSIGPNRVRMNASYTEASSPDFQDALGTLILDHCEKINHGVLCFFPSYQLMDKLVHRWTKTGLYEKLLFIKQVVSEPRKKDEQDNSDSFDTLMKRFYQSIDEEHDTRTGGLFLAVCRGKVSEGIDFSDNYCRGVIVVGIPFPNVKDLKISLKKQYNDDRKRLTGSNVVDGQTWYCQQAYRALNQAVGRCIRHKHDYGAIILVDERYSKDQRHIGSLSKWFRSVVKNYDSYGEAMVNLRYFYEQIRKNPPAPPAVVLTSKKSIQPPMTKVEIVDDDFSMSESQDTQISQDEDFKKKPPVKKKTPVKKEVKQEPKKLILKKKSRSPSTQTQLTQFYDSNSMTQAYTQSFDSESSMIQPLATQPMISQPLTQVATQPDTLSLTCKCNKILVTFTHGKTVKNKLSSRVVLNKPYLATIHHTVTQSENNVCVYKVTPRLWNDYVSNNNCTLTNVPMKQLGGSQITLGDSRSLIVTNQAEDGSINCGWSSQDGIVYELLWCGECKECVGVKIIATDTANIHLVGERWLFTDMLDQVGASKSPLPILQQDQVFVISDEEL